MHIPCAATRGCLTHCIGEVGVEVQVDDFVVQIGESHILRHTSASLSACEVVLLPP
jgi:hypothetical protein